MSESTNHLDHLLGFTKPISELTDTELIAALMPHFPHTRPLGGSLDELIKDPLLANIPGIQDIIKKQQTFKLG
jgi:hypothetical protein